MRALVGTLALSLILIPSAISAGAAGDMFAFSINTLDAKHDATDMSWMNDRPAGKNGFVRVKDGHFVDGAGRRLRLLGVNLCFAAAFPEHADADKLAARLAKLGINCVRLHHMDNTYPPSGIWDRAFPDKQHLDAGQLDKLDYLIFALKKHGIYVDINLHVSRQFSEADGFVDTAGLTKYDKGVDNFEPRMIALQRNYARDLLTHFNPYTKTRYVDEPAVAIIEINNENSLVGFCIDTTIFTIPDYYLAELRRQWNEWLKARYRTTSALRKAWEAGAEPIGDNILANSDFSAGTDRWTLEAPSPAKAAMHIEDGGPQPGMKCIHAALTREGLRSWDFQVHQIGLDLAEGKPYVLRFWARANQPRRINVDVRLDRDPWTSAGLSKSIELPVAWKHYEFSFTATGTQKNHNRLSFSLQSTLGEVWIAGVELRRGSGGRLPESASLEAGNIDLPTNSFTAAQREDFLAFAAETERRYAVGMRDFIKNTLGAKALVVDTQVTYGGMAGLYRESMMDFGDIHAYWQHPSFPRKAWDPTDWTVANTPMVRALGSDTLTRMAVCRLADKPFTVSEYNHPAPSDYSAECVPMLAAFAALQDWDGIFLFDYHSSQGDWDRQRISGYFSIDSHPAKIVFLPAATAMFRRADVAPMNSTAMLEFPAATIPRHLRIHGASVSAAWQSLGFAAREAMCARTAVRFTDKGEPVLKYEKADERPNAVWQCEKGKEQDAVFLIDSPAARGVIGFASGRQIKLSGLTIELKGDKFAVITVVALDGKPLERSGHVLISAVGRVENTGMVWNADRTSVGRNWGDAPVVAEGIEARVTLGGNVKRAEVYALDGGGGRARAVACEAASGKLAVDLGPQWKTLWYELVIER